MTNIKIKEWNDRFFVIDPDKKTIKFREDAPDFTVEEFLAVCEAYIEETE